MSVIEVDALIVNCPATEQDIVSLDMSLSDSFAGTVLGGEFAGVLAIGKREYRAWKYVGRTRIRQGKLVNEGPD